MKRTLLITAVVLVSMMGLNAQTTHFIEAGGGGVGNPAPYFDPQFITIEVGDIVQWTNSGGTHNVDGTTATFPDNPEGFTSGEPSNAAWVFEHTFTIEGFYEFECAAFNHAETQFGNITVIDGSTSVETAPTVEFNVYPNPTRDWVNVESDQRITRVEVFTIDMKRVKTINVLSPEFSRLFVGDLDNGIYLIRLQVEGGYLTEKVVVE